MNNIPHLRVLRVSFNWNNNSITIKDMRAEEFDKNKKVTFIYNHELNWTLGNAIQYLFDIWFSEDDIIWTWSEKKYYYILTKNFTKEIDILKNVKFKKCSFEFANENIESNYPLFDRETNKFFWTKKVEKVFLNWKLIWFLTHNENTTWFYNLSWDHFNNVKDYIKIINI